MAIWGLFNFWLESLTSSKTSTKRLLTFHQEIIVSESFERIGILALYTNIHFVHTTCYMTLIGTRNISNMELNCF